MPVFMVTVPNPGALDNGAEHRDGRVHYVWPFKLGLRIALIMAFAVGANFLRKQNKAAKECY